MKRTNLTGIAALVLLAFVALLGAGAVADVITPPGTVVADGPVQGAAPGGPGSWPDAPALGPTGGTLLLSAGFDGANLNSWRSEAPTPADEPAQWRTLGGKLVQNGDAGGSWSDDEALLLSGDAAWSDYLLEAHVYATSGSPVGLAWRAGKGEMYRLRLFQDLPNGQPKARLELVSAGYARMLATAPVSTYAGYNPGAWQALRVATQGDRHAVWVDGVQLFDVQDATLKSGQVGLFATADGAAAFDNVRVQAGATGR